MIGDCLELAYTSVGMSCQQGTESRPELFGTSVVLQLRNKQNLETEDSERSDHGGCGHQSENYFLTIYSLQEEVLMILTLFIKNSDSLLEPK